MKIHYLILLFILIGLSCQTEGSELEDFEEIQEVFNINEIEALKQIIKFFQESICKADNIDSNQILECYDDYFENIKKSTETGKMEIQIPLSKQKDFMATLSQISFEQIWNDGKYLEFLKKFGEVNEYVKLYVDDFISAGDLSPGMASNLLLNSQKFDISDERIKLFVAVHYLTMNEWTNQ